MTSGAIAVLVIVGGSLLVIWMRTRDWSGSAEAEGRREVLDRKERRAAMRERRRQRRWKP